MVHTGTVWNFGILVLYVIFSLGACAVVLGFVFFSFPGIVFVLFVMFFLLLCFGKSTRILLKGLEQVLSFWSLFSPLHTCRLPPHTHTKKQSQQPNVSSH